MKGKLCTPNEHTEMSDLNKVDTSVEGKFGRVVLRCLRDENGMDRFIIFMEPKSTRPEPANQINIGKEKIVICQGLLDFEHVSKAIQALEQ